MNADEVTEFVVVPPFAEMTQIDANWDRMRVFLARRFPGYTFSMRNLAAVREDRLFLIVPIMGYTGDDGRRKFCAEPPSWLLSEIREACHEFCRSGLRFYAA